MRNENRALFAEATYVAHLPTIADLLDLEYVEENLYRSCAVFDEPYRLFGGQVAAQALLAAGHTVPDGRLPHSLHGYFLRRGSTKRPTVFRVERDRHGQSFSARRVVAIQEGEVIFNMSASFAMPQPKGSVVRVPLVRLGAAAAEPVLDPVHRRIAGWAEPGPRGWYTGAVYTREGVRVASIAQETLFRTRHRGAGAGRPA